MLIEINPRRETSSMQEPMALKIMSRSLSLFRKAYHHTSQVAFLFSCLFVVISVSVDTISREENKDGYSPISPVFFLLVSIEIRFGHYQSISCHIRSASDCVRSLSTFSWPSARFEFFLFPRKTFFLYNIQRRLHNIVMYTVTRMILGVLQRYSKWKKSSLCVAVNWVSMLWLIWNSWRGFLYSHLSRGLSAIPSRQPKANDATEVLAHRNLVQLTHCILLLTIASSYT